MQCQTSLNQFNLIFSGSTLFKTSSGDSKPSWFAMCFFFPSYRKHYFSKLPVFKADIIYGLVLQVTFLYNIISDYPTSILIKSLSQTSFKMNLRRQIRLLAYYTIEIILKLSVWVKNYYQLTHIIWICIFMYGDSELFTVPQRRESEPNHFLALDRSVFRNISHLTLTAIGVLVVPVSCKQILM